MEGVLQQEKEEIRKYTRELLGRVRDAISKNRTTDHERLKLAESIKQIDELFLLVVAGEFNSGKSSFINALLGSDLLHEGVTPTTTKVQIVKYGEPGQALGDGGLLTTTAQCSLLEHINIVDTPGTNAIQREHESITDDFIPRSDLVLFITSADRPFSHSEQIFLERIKSWGKKIVLIVNKIDIFQDKHDTNKVMDFVQISAKELIGNIAATFSTSARLAKLGRKGNDVAWKNSGFEILEDYIKTTLDDSGRFRLKLLNPLGICQKLIKSQLKLCLQDLTSLEDDRQMIDDIERQTTVFDSDMKAEFENRLSEIDSLPKDMETRGLKFFDETMRIGRIPDLMRREKIQKEFTNKVIGDLPQQIERRISDMIDWMVEQDLQQWNAVVEHLEARRKKNRDRVVGASNTLNSALSFDRQRLIDSIGMSVRETISSYDKDEESQKMSMAAREAVINTGIVGIGGTGLGTALVLLFNTVSIDIIGVVAGLTAMTIGALILPFKRRKAKKNFSEKLADLREKLVAGLKEQFNRELRRSKRRIDDIVAPFSRFIRAEESKVTRERDTLQQLDTEVEGLISKVESL